MSNSPIKRDHRRDLAGIVEPLYHDAINALGLNEKDTVVVFCRAKDQQAWSRAQKADPSAYDLTKFDVISVTRNKNAFGDWLEITDHVWSGPVNNGKVHVGVGVMDSQLYQLDESALFYGEDFEPYWSPVVHADTKEVALLFNALVAKNYPVMECDGTDPVAWDHMLKQKEAAGFLYHPKEESFAHVSVFRFDDELHKQLYLALSQKSANDPVKDVAASLLPVIQRFRPELSDWLDSEAGMQAVQSGLSHLHIKPDNVVVLSLREQISQALDREREKKQALLASQRQAFLPKDSPPAVHFYHGGKAWLGDFEINAKKNGGMEHGPGLYLTNGMETARNYAKGGGVVQQIAIRADARLMDGVKCSADEMIQFVKQNSVRNGKKMIADIERNAEKMNSRTLDLEVLINLMINNDALKPAVAPALNEFIVSHGVDMNVFKAPMWSSHGGGNDEWVVVFNPKVVLAKQKVDMKQFDWSESRLPTYQEQLAAINARPALTSESEQHYRRKI